MKAFKAFIKSFAVPQRSVKIKFYHEFFSLSGIGMRRVKWRKINSFLLTALNSLQVFSDRYVECNPGKVTDNPDTILLLAFALAMLNTDLHNQNVKRRMTVEDFIKNLRGADNGNDLDEHMLTNMYSRIQKVYTHVCFEDWPYTRFVLSFAFRQQLR